jgi:quercetin dioxygenase-like cupin family protein
MKTLRLIGFVVGCWLLGTLTANAQGITEKVLLDNEWVTVAEVTVPPKAAGGAHANPGPEMGYLLEGTLTVTTVPEGKRVQKTGEVLWLPADTLHKIQNDQSVPAKALVILLKKRP